MRTRIARVELQPESGCTLSCRDCQHFSPQRGRGSASAADYLPHLHTLWKFASWNSIFIGGGEPLLYHDLAGFIRETHDGQPWGDRRPDLITNGFWLLRRDWRDVAGRVLPLVAALVVSRYPVYVDRLGIAEWDKRLDVLRSDHPTLNILSFHGSDPSTLTFTHNDFLSTPKPILAPHPCNMRFCFQLRTDGILTKCPLGRGLDLIPNATPEFLASYRGYSLYDLARDGEGFAEWAAPDSHPACSLCGIATGDSRERSWVNGVRTRV